MKDCNSCGKCCIKYSNGRLSASTQEIEQWQDESPHIAAYVQEGEIWFDPATKQRFNLCPWLERAPNSTVYTCAIYYDRPDDCRSYPGTFQDMVIDECEMVEAKDLRDPIKAKQALKIIMSDSWR